MIAYSATLDVPADTTTLLTDLLIAERRRRGTGIGARAVSARTQAVLVLRWFRKDTGMPTLACDAGVSVPTGYRYLHEGIDVLAAQAPDLHDALEAGTAAGWSHGTVDGTLIRTDRCRTKNPTPATTCGSPASTRRQCADHRRPRRAPGRGLRRAAWLDS